MRHGRTIGIGSMAVDHIRRVPRILGREEKGMLKPLPSGQVEERRVGGVVLNHLGWAACLGLPVGIFGKQADDAGGRFLRAAMDRLGIEWRIELDGSASTFADIYVDDDGERAIYMAPGATSETTPKFLRKHFKGFIQGAGRVTTEVSQLPLDAVLSVLEMAKDAGVPTLLDLDVPPSDAVPGLGDDATLQKVLHAADILKPAKAAGAELVPAAGDALELAEALRERYGNQAVLVTDGDGGCAIAADDVALRIPAYAPKEVLDTTGAGDAFLGGLLFALDRDLSWDDAGKLANACGAACVERIGAFPEDANAALGRVRDLYDGSPVDFEPPANLSQVETTSGEGAVSAFALAVEELQALGSRIEAETFGAAAQLIRSVESSGGRVHVTGIGKPEHVARYGASVLSSTGTPATFLHGTEAIHGSAGQVVAGDVVIAISNSGETVELLATVEAVSVLGATVIAVTGRRDSSLASAASLVLEAGVGREGGGLGLAPRASVAAEILVLGALSAALEESRGFSKADYHARHPAGVLGKASR